MSKDRLSSEIPPLLLTRQERILQALCVAVGADYVYFMPDSEAIVSTCHIANPLREVGAAIDPYQFFSARNLKQNKICTTTTDNNETFFIDDLPLNGLHGKLLFFNEPRDQDGSPRKFEAVNLNVYNSLKNALTQAFAQDGLQHHLHKVTATNAMVKFANECVGHMTRWHPESGAHSDNVAILYNAFIEMAASDGSHPFHYAFKGMTAEEKLTHNALAVLHDIGKTLIPHDVIAYEGKYSDEQRAQMQLHAAAGYYIMGAFGIGNAQHAGQHHQFHKAVDKEKLDAMQAEDPKLRAAYPICESFSGQVPLGVRILQVMDCFEGIIHMRGYKCFDGRNGRPARTIDEALPILVKEANAGVLDPVVVHAFIKDKIYEAALNFTSTTLAKTDNGPQAINEFDPLQGRFGMYGLHFQNETFARTNRVRDILLSEKKAADFPGVGDKTAENLSELEACAEIFRDKVQRARDELRDLAPGNRVEDGIPAGRMRSPGLQPVAANSKESTSVGY